MLSNFPNNFLPFILSSLNKHGFESFAKFPLKLICLEADLFICCWAVGLSSVVLKINLLLDEWFVNVFSHSITFLLIWSFGLQNIFFYFCFHWLHFWCNIQELITKTKIQNLFLIFSQFYTLWVCVPVYVCLVEIQSIL